MDANPATPVTEEVLNAEYPQQEVCDPQISLSDRVKWLEEEFIRAKLERSSNPDCPCPSTKSDDRSSTAGPHPLYPTAAKSSALPDPDLYLPQLLNMAVGMPKKELPVFRGNPVDYWKFRRGFENGVSQYVTDPGNRLSFLIQYCEGEARDAISHCTILEPSEGYDEAWSILQRRFGNPFVISREYLASIVDGPTIKHDDAKGLIKLAENMKACELTLKQLNFSAELNTRSTMCSIVQRLPTGIQHRWYDTAAELFRSNREPTFTHLTRFIQERAEACSVRQMYQPGLTIERKAARGATNLCTLDETPTETCSVNQTTHLTRATVRASQPASSNWRPSCPKCKGTHYLDQCPTFIEMNIEERTKFVRTELLCALCLKPRHTVEQCRSRKICGVGNCHLLHHPLLHVENLQQRTMNTIIRHRTDFTNNSIRSKHHPSKIALGVVRLLLRGPSGTTMVNALLDSGSDATLMLRQTAESIGLIGDPATVNFSTLTGRSLLPTERVSFQLNSVPPGFSMDGVKAWTVAQLPHVTRFVPDTEQLSRWKYLSDLDYEVTGDETPISVLIGLDVAAAHHVLETRLGAPHEPYAVKTPLGWMILGPITDGHENTAVCNCSMADLVPTSELPQAPVCTDFNDEPTSKRGCSQEDELALAIVQNSIRKVDGHIELALPWKVGCPSLSSNYLIVSHRLSSLKRRLQANSVLKTRYVSAMHEYIAKGYAEEVSIKSTMKLKSWYIPHHPVVHPHKPGKVRIVFDCACKVGGTSLNQQLMSGPDMVNSLFGVLLRFRQSPFVITADIEAMFHQVKLPKPDRDYLRFLWWPDGDCDKEPRIYRMTVHPFGATSSPFCASFALNRALTDWAADNCWDKVCQASRSFYVDDFLFSTSVKSDLSKIASAVKSALKSSGFRLTKWSSNDEEFMATIPEEEKAVKRLILDLQPTSVQRTLGVLWDVDQDELFFSVGDAPDFPTRRKMLSFIASIYDPLGFLSPVTLGGRLLFQDTCRKGLNWDENLPEDLHSKWNEWTKSIRALLAFRMTRCLTAIDGSLDVHELHCFSDASSKAYGVAVYLLSQKLDGSSNSSLICGRSRVAPLHSVSIPRLELTAAVLAAKITLQVKEEMSLPIAAVHYWTDSMIVLQTLRNQTTRFPVFVANRISTIRQLSSISQWRYVDSKQNPADIASRGILAKKLQDSMWATGPSFLSLPQEFWPTEPWQAAAEVSDQKNLDCNVVHAEPDWLMNLSGYRTWTKLLRAVAWLRRFCEYLSKGHSGSSRLPKFLNVDELNAASQCIVRLVQKNSFSAELRALRAENPEMYTKLPKGSALRKLNPFIQSDLLRVGGRLKWALIPFEAKHPLIMPQRHFVSRLIIDHFHIINGHMGTSQVLAAVRQKYWILNGLSCVKSVLKNCYHCRKWHSQPCYQVMGQLPADRVRVREHPFSDVGVDYFGPILIKRGRKTEKRYGCIFTCMTVRAIHIEIAHTLETDSFLCAFARFAARRGCPTHLRSDNGTNFKGAEAEIRSCIQTWDQQKISQRLTDQGCDWTFTAPTASHQGGAWERMIRSIRRVLLSLLGDSLVDEETLLTAHLN